MMDLGDAGKVISHYRVIEKIGAGGMGVVFKAQDLKPDRYVALKFLPAELKFAWEEKQRFIQEAKIISAFKNGIELRGPRPHQLLRINPHIS